MIVISGALVLVALVLLVIGLIGPSLGFVYASIGASLAAFAFLVVGILQRRKAEPAVVEGAPASAEELAAVIRTPEPASATADVALVTTAQAGSGEQVSGTVLVVQGRPRYHVSGCRYLSGKLGEEIDVAQARAEGFTACGVCKPDAALAAAPAALEQVAPEPVAEEVAVVEAPAKAAVKRAAKAPAKAPAKVAAKAPAKVAAVATKPAAATKATAAKPTAVKAAAKTATKAATKTAAKPGVVVIPDRDKFHTPDCRYVRGAEEATELTRAVATRQGYVACGVCKP